MAKFALSDPIFKILNRSTGKATNKYTSKLSIKGLSYLGTLFLCLQFSAALVAGHVD